jgi:SNF2 family DNA or RNA helicase
VHLKDFDLGYVILDEAQAIKNPASQTAKACRLLKADHRLALTGTPVENHLGELWSIFDFLNPGMLGRLPGMSARSAHRSPSKETLEQVARALGPFILRRTKEEVLSDLPPKTEQTLYCDLGSRQRRIYDGMREHYRRILTQKIGEEGLDRSKIQVLEALLRLRQAACHPGLISEKHERRSSAKLDVLLEQVEEVIDEGHKALVFSQFTRLLALVRHELDERNITYEYLDGKTRKREEKIQRFQEDAECPLFLISLKAGGVGLNLTAADYVFLLDPWWNPAVEAQAIDRAHRIGQVRPVNAYRLIARNTVEEKIVKLQASKRDLADAILTADRSVISELTSEDLEMLLSD